MAFCKEESNTHVQLDRRLEISDNRANLTGYEMKKNIIDGRIQELMTELIEMSKNCNEMPSEKCDTEIMNMNSSIKVLERERELNQTRISSFARKLSLFPR
jgi:predicted RNase H-like nuclease (RuvC/YqgF family)